MAGVQGLEGIRVLEVAGGVGLAYAAKLFADLGADVIRLEAATTTVVRARPHEVHRWLNTNKRSQWVDGAPSSGWSATPTCSSTTSGPAPPAPRGGTPSVAASATRRWSWAPARRSARRGPWADHAADRAHRHPRGRAWGFLSPGAATDLDQPPLKAPGHHATLLTATVAATAFLAAVDRARAQRRRRSRRLLRPGGGGPHDRDGAGHRLVPRRERLPCRRAQRRAVEHLPVPRRPAAVHLCRGRPVAQPGRADGHARVGDAGRLRHHRRSGGRTPT